MRERDKNIEQTMLAKWRRRAARLGIPLPERVWVDAHYAPQYWNGCVGFIRHDPTGATNHVATYHYDLPNDRIFYSGLGEAYWSAKTAVETMLEGFNDALVSQTRYPIEKGMPLVRDQLHVFWRYGSRCPLPRRFKGIRIHVHEHTNPYGEGLWSFAMDHLPPDPNLAISVEFPVPSKSHFETGRSAIPRFLTGQIGNPDAKPSISLTYSTAWRSFSGRWLHDVERGSFRKREDEKVTQHETALLSALLPSIRIFGTEIKVSDEDLVLMRLAAQDEENA